MNTLSIPVPKSQSCPQQSMWRRKGLWIAFAVVALPAAAVSFFGWGGIAKALPYTLILACPAMHFLMCRNQKPSRAGDGAAPK